jgi:hypothetical protein
MPTQGKSWRMVNAALRAAPGKWTGTRPAKLLTFRILNAAARAAHRWPLRHGPASGWVAHGQAPRRAPLIWVCGMRCLYSRRGPVSSEKHDPDAEAGADEGGSDAAGVLTVTVVWVATVLGLHPSRPASIWLTLLKDGG